MQQYFTNQLDSNFARQHVYYVRLTPVPVPFGYPEFTVRGTMHPEYAGMENLEFVRYYNEKNILPVFNESNHV